MDQELKDAIVRETTKEVLRLSEELVDQVLFGNLKEAPLELVSDKVDLNRLRFADTEAYVRVCIAAAIRKKFGGSKHAARQPRQNRRHQFPFFSGR